MASLLVSAKIAEQLIFGFAEKPVHISAVRYDADREVLVFEVHGDDIPDVTQVSAICREQTNRAGQRFTTMAFEPVG